MWPSLMISPGTLGSIHSITNQTHMTLLLNTKPLLKTNSPPPLNNYSQMVEGNTPPFNFNHFWPNMALHSEKLAPIPLLKMGLPKES
jgi:hypothetical protein